MIEGGGLGVFKPEEVGPIDMQTKSGVVDVRVHDEAAAVAVAKRYLGYFQGPHATWSCADQAALRDVMPASRRRVYRIRPIFETIADIGSVLELRADFGKSIVTALARIEGRPLGVIANDTYHLAGAIDSDAARVTGSGRRPWQAGTSARRSSPSRGRPASSAAWASKERCASG